MIIFFVYFVDAVNNLLGQLYGQMFFGVVQHACADAVFSARAFQYIYVDASFATSPEGFVVGEVGEGYGLITQLGVHGHNGSTAGKTEYLSVWPTGAGQREGHVFDALG